LNSSSLHCIKQEDYISQTDHVTIHVTLWRGNPSKEKAFWGLTGGECFGGSVTHCTPVDEAQAVENFSVLP